jgi:GNAT superfamily N-acetyltransferase
MIVQTVRSSDLLSRLELQEAAYWSEYYLNVPPEIKNWLGIHLLNAGTASAGVVANIDILAFNRAMGLGMEQPATERQLDEIIAFYRDAGASRFFIQLSPHAEPENLREILQKKGFQYYNNWVKFYREIDPLPLANSQMRIEQIGAERADVFAEIIVSVFEWPERLKPIIALPVGRPGWKHYFAYEAAKPVACAALFTRGEYATLAFAATLPEYRGLGAQSALIARRFRDAAESGCHWMLTETAEETLQRPVASFRNMLRHGFQIAYKRPNYIYIL